MFRFRLKELLEKKCFNEGRRITLSQVADDCGLNRMTLSKIANQKAPNAGLDTLDRLCFYFDCEISDLIEHVKRHPSTVSQSE